MAGKPRFRVPTLEEMESADQEEAVLSARPVIKRGTTIGSKPADTSSGTKIDAPASAQSSPPKRMISQKALLSRQPLSSQLSSGKGKISPKKNAQTSSGKGEPTSSGNSTKDILSRHRVSHVTNDNISTTNLNLKGPSALSITEAGAAGKGISSEWTGSALGGNSRNVGTVSRLYHQPANSTDAGRQDEDDARQPNQQHAAASNSEQTADGQDAIRADVLPTLAKLGKTNSLVVNSRQRGNPILKFVRNVPWEFGNIVPDYVMGQCNCALYLSLRYHQLHPEYIHTRLKQLGHSFDLRVLLVQVDIKDPHHLLKDLAKICILADCTLMLAFSAEEAGRYLETYKVYENKAAEAIMERSDSNFSVQLSDCLTRVKSVNKTDCSTLLATFGSLQGIMEASVEDLSLCPGFGPQKAKRLHDVFREPFLVSKKQRMDAGKSSSTLTK